MAVSTPVNTGYTIINGTTTGSNGSKVNTWIEYKVTSQDVVANTSTIRVILYSQATWDSGTAHEVTKEYGYVNIDSSRQKYSMTGGYDFGNKKLNKFADHTFTVTHGTDGKKTVTIGGAWNDLKSNGQPWSSYISGGSASASVTLPQIARASTVSSLSATLGTAGTITITRQDSSFTHTLQYSFDNSSWTNIATGVGASYSWSPSVDLISSFSNSKTKTGYIRCITYSGGTQVGTSTSSLTLTAPSSSLANVTGTYGTALTLTATNACASGLTYTFQYHDGSAWTSIASGVTGKTRSWTPGTSLIANVDNASTGTISIRVITYVGTATVNTASATATLTIPKNTSSARSGTIGSALSIPITKAHSKLTSTITYSFGSNSNVLIVDKTTSTSYSWTPSTSLLSEIPSATSGVGTIKIESFNGTKSLGSNTYDLTLAVANNVVPTVSFDAPVRVNNNATVESWGIYLQGYSAVKIKLRANGVSGSTISRMSITGQGISSASTPGTSSAYLETTSSIFGAAGTFSYTGAATDSRGRSASEARSSNIVVQAYSSPSVTNTRIVRCNSDGTENTAGTSLKVTLNSSYTQVGQNAFTAHLEYKSASDTSWTTVTATAIDPSTANIFNLGLSAQQNYYTRVRYSDSLSGYQYTTEITIPSEERIINVNASGKGLAIGGFSTEPGKLQVYYPADFEGNTLPTINNLPFVAEAKGFALYGGTQIPANSDLNDDTFVGAGTWWCNTNADAQSLSNCPTNYGFRMIVMKTLRPATPSGSGFNWNMALQTIYDYWGNIYTRYIGYMDDATTKRVGDWQIQTYNYATITETNPTSASAQIAYNLIPNNSVGVVALRRNGATEWVCLVQRNSASWGSVLMTGQANEGTKKFLLQNGSWKPERWFAEEFYNDTGGDTWQEMVKNKIDYVKSNYPTGHVYILAGGWSGQEWGYSFVNYPNSTHISIDFYGIAGVKKYHGYWDGTNYSYKNLTVGEFTEVTGTSKTYTASGSDNAVASIALTQGMWLVSTYVRCTGTAANSKFELYYSNFQSDHRSGGWQVTANSPLYMQHHNEVNVGYSGYTLNVGVYHSGACTIDAIYIKATSIGNN